MQQPMSDYTTLHKFSIGPILCRMETSILSWSLTTFGFLVLISSPLPLFSLLQLQWRLWCSENKPSSFWLKTSLDVPAASNSLPHCFPRVHPFTSSMPLSRVIHVFLQCQWASYPKIPSITLLPFPSLFLSKTLTTTYPRAEPLFIYCIPSINSVWHIIRAKLMVTVTLLIVIMRNWKGTILIQKVPHRGPYLRKG
jgi:hypothetical protein